MREKLARCISLLVSVSLIVCMLPLFAGKIHAQTEASAKETQKNAVFRGLEADEMYIGGFIGPRPTYKRNGKVIFEGLKNDSVFTLIKEAGIDYFCDNDFSFSGDMLADPKTVLQYAEDNDPMYLMPAYDAMKVDGEIMASDSAIAA